MKKVLVDKKGRKYLWDKGDLHTSLGIVKEKNIKKGRRAKSHLKKEFLIYPASFTDKSNNLPHELEPSLNFNTEAILV